jgi:endonuclease YncB( thermonuclease family)
MSTTPRLLSKEILAFALTVATVLGVGPSPVPASAAGGDRDCSDFANQAQAQKFFEAHNPSADPHQLDGDGDGIACESNPCPCDTGGGGGNDDPKVQRDHARVVSVTDGDTIRVTLRSRTEDVRLIGIDTPEVFGGEECGGQEASDSAREMLPAQSRVLLISDPSQDNRDRFDRLLRYVKHGSQDINRTQVARGWADVYVYNNNPFKRVRGYRSARDDAKRNDRGAWGQCGGFFQARD